MNSARRKTEIWAHRGATAYYPENTLEAFKEAIDAGADGIELDVRMSRDGEIVVFHDETLRRLGGMSRHIREMALHELRGIRLEGFLYGGTIPTMEEVLDLIKDSTCRLNIEIKDPFNRDDEFERRLVRLVQGFGLESRVVYSSFNHYVLANLRDIDPPSPIGLLAKRGSDTLLERARSYRVNAIHPHWRLIRSEGQLKGLRESGFKIHVWTVDHPARLERFMNWGADSIITDFPERALELRDKIVPVRFRP